MTAAEVKTSKSRCKACGEFKKPSAFRRVGRAGARQKTCKACVARVSDWGAAFVSGLQMQAS